MKRVRAPFVRIVDRGDETTVLGADGVGHKFAGPSAALVRAVLASHARPVTREELLATLAAQAEGEVAAEPVDQLVEILTRAGVLVTPGPARSPAGRPRRVVLGISGAVSAIDAPALVRGLQGIGCEVRVALTRAARRFVAPDALTALTHHRAHRGLWDRHAACPVPHVNLAEWAELVVVCPATATTIARLAGGSGVDLVAAIVLATAAPVIVVPSMNARMIASPAVERNLEALRADGRWLVHPALGFEVAHPPSRRAPGFGPAPPAAVVVDVVRHVLATIPVPSPVLPATAEAWEDVWALPIRELPWFTEELDEDLAAILDSTPPGKLVDLGCGAGTVAIAAARRGHDVTATEVSARALGLARRRAGDLPITWLLDDVTRSRLGDGFMLAVDRGLLHCLPRPVWPAYAATVSRVVTPGGALLVKAHAEGDLAVAPAELAGLLGDAFTVESDLPSTLSGVASRLVLLRRR